MATGRKSLQREINPGTPQVPCWMKGILFPIHGSGHVEPLEEDALPTALPIVR